MRSPLTRGSLSHQLLDCRYLGQGGAWGGSSQVIPFAIGHVAQPTMRRLPQGLHIYTRTHAVPGLAVGEGHGATAERITAFQPRCKWPTPRLSPDTMDCADWTLTPLPPRLPPGTKGDDNCLTVRVGAGQAGPVTQGGGEQAAKHLGQQGSMLLDMLPCPIGLHLQNTNSKSKLL